MMTTPTRTCECDGCGGVMESVWSDGKTRIHAMRCLSCGDEVDRHQRKLKYIETRHGDLFEELDVHAMDYGEFIEAFEEFRRETTNEAFDNLHVISATQISKHKDGSYTVGVYSDIEDEGEGIGDSGRMPHGQPDVSWNTDCVLINDSEIEMVDLNDGSAYFYLRHVRSVTIEENEHPDEEDLVRIST